MARHSPLGSLVISAFAQCIGFVVGLGSLSIIPATGNQVNEILVLPITLHAVVALALARWLKLGKVWQVSNLILPLFIIASSHVAIPGWVLGVVAMASVLVYLPTLFSGVPYYPTSEAMYRGVLKGLPIADKGDKALRFIDLGCGFSGLLRYLAKERPGDQFAGVEIGVIPYLISLALCAPYKNITISFRSMWEINLSEFEAVYAFLAPGPMPKLWDKVKAEMRPGTTFLSNSFPVPDEATEKITIGEGRQSVLYIYRR